MSSSSIAFGPVVIYPHLAPNTGGTFLLLFLWQSTTATSANHCSTVANCNSSSQGLCDEVLFPSYGWGTVTSRVWFQKHRVTLNAQCEHWGMMFFRVLRTVHQVFRGHVGKQMCAYVISTRSQCKHARVIWNARCANPYVCHCAKRICVVASLAVV